MKTRTRGVPIATVTRDALRVRSQGRCERCRQQAPSLDAHHRQQRSCGGQDTLSNLVHLCRRCHGVVHDSNSYEFGWLVRSWETPADVTIHLWNGRSRLNDDGEVVREPR